MIAVRAVARRRTVTVTRSSTLGATAAAGGSDKTSRSPVFMRIHKQRERTLSRWRYSPTWKTTDRRVLPEVHVHDQSLYLGNGFAVSCGKGDASKGLAAISASQAVFTVRRVIDCLKSAVNIPHDPPRSPSEIRIPVPFSLRSTQLHYALIYSAGFRTIWLDSSRGVLIDQERN